MTHASDVVLPKSLIIELIESHCSYPKPDPKINVVLTYDCYANEQQDSEFYENYSLELIPLITKDYNQDGVADIAVEVRSSGALGGNVNTNSAIYYLLLDKNKKIIGEHQILLYAPFSENIVDYNVNKSRIYYSAIPNYRSHPESYEDGEPIDPPLEFEVNWLDGVPISSYYRDNCALAGYSNSNQIFIPKHGVKRSKQIDIHEYTQIIEEKMAINSLLVAAELNGCNERKISFFIEPQDGKPLPVLADVIQALLSKTYYDKQLQELLKLDKQSQIVFGEVMTLKDNWVGQIHINREINNSSIQINLFEAE